MYIIIHIYLYQTVACFFYSITVLIVFFSPHNYLYVLCGKTSLASCLSKNVLKFTFTLAYTLQFRNISLAVRNLFFKNVSFFSCCAHHDHSRHLRSSVLFVILTTLFLATFSWMVIIHIRKLKWSWQCEESNTQKGYPSLIRCYSQ